jgi:hypothetical protein
MTERLLLHEHALADGAFERMWLEMDGDRLVLHVEGEPKKEVPLQVLDIVMRRYGKPLDDDVGIDGPRLVIADRTIAMLRYRPRYDVIAKDYVVYAATGEPPVAELATAVAGALQYLVRRESVSGGAVPAPT